MTVSTHVLDATRGLPAAGVAITFESQHEDGWKALAQRVTDEDGRVGDLVSDLELPAGAYRITFAVEAYFADLGIESFYPSISITFRVVDPLRHYHVPILLSPFAYSTYRGS
jgi:5-hydroxyisourate hydrolase